MRVPERISTVLQRLEAATAPPARIPRPSADVLFMLVHLFRPQHMVEVGTGHGYSAIVLGSAAQAVGGTLTTIERNGKLAEDARQNVWDAGLQDVVTVVPGSAHKGLKRLSQPVDMAFLDATKQEYGAYLDRLEPQFTERALLCINDVLSHEPVLLPVLERVLLHDTYTSAIVPVGGGVLLAIRTDPTAEGQAATHAMTSLHDLVMHASARVFRGTAQEVQSGEIRPRLMKECGYDQSLDAEGERLPEEDVEE